MCSILSLIGREDELFLSDVKSNSVKLSAEVCCSSFLVIGGAGTIGQAVTKEIFKRNPKKLHVVDLSENNLVELVRDLRSSFGYIAGDFKTMHYMWAVESMMPLLKVMGNTTMCLIFQH